MNTNSINFESNCYFYLAINSEDFSYNSIGKKQDEKLKFNYINITLENFREAYSKEAIAENPSISKCLSQAAFLGVVKTIYHLALGFFALITYGRNNEKSQAFLYSARWDLEESYGNLVRLTDKTKGLYYIQRAQFHRSCYDCFTNPNKNVEISVNDISARHKLIDIFIKRQKFDEAIEQTALLQSPDEFYFQIANALCLAGQLEQSLKVLDKITDQKTKQKTNDTYFTVANNYIVQQNFQKVMEIVSKIEGGEERKNLIYSSCVNGFLSQDRVDDALQLIPKISDEQKKKSFYIQCADKLFPNDINKALQIVLDNVCDKSLEPDTVYYSFAEKSFAEGKFKESFKILDKVSKLNRKTNELYSKLADHFVKVKQFKKIAAIASKIKDNDELKNAMYITCIEEFLTKNEINEALELIPKITDIKNRGAFYLSAASQLYKTNQNNIENSLKKYIDKASSSDNCFNKDEIYFFISTNLYEDKNFSKSLIIINKVQDKEVKQKFYAAYLDHAFTLSLTDFDFSIQMIKGVINRIDNEKAARIYYDLALYFYGNKKEIKKPLEIIKENCDIKILKDLYEDFIVDIFKLDKENINDAFEIICAYLDDDSVNYYHKKFLKEAVESGVGIKKIVTAIKEINSFVLKTFIDESLIANKEKYSMDDLLEIIQSVNSKIKLKEDTITEIALYFLNNNESTHFITTVEMIKSLEERNSLFVKGVFYFNQKGLKDKAEELSRKILNK